MNCVAASSGTAATGLVKRHLPAAGMAWLVALLAGTPAGAVAPVGVTTVEWADARSDNRSMVIIQVFGFDEAGLGELRVPTYVVVGEGDTVAPAKENAEYAASHIPSAKLNVLPGPVQHYDFMNECEDETKGEFIEVCFDAPGVDRAQIHELVGKEAVAFFDASLGVAR